MAVGDVKSGLSSVATGAVLDIQAGSGEEWVIHNIYHESDIDLQWYDGTNTLTWASAIPGPGAETNLQSHVTNTRRVRVKNTNASTKLIGYDGVQTK